MSVIEHAARRVDAQLFLGQACGVFRPVVRGNLELEEPQDEDRDDEEEDASDDGLAVAQVHRLRGRG